MGFALWFHGSAIALAAASMVDPISLVQISATIHHHGVESPPQEYFYSSRSRGPMTNNFAPYSARNNFSAGPTWVWQNDLDEEVRHSPMIDADKNIYVCTKTRVRKFDSDGNLQWIWQAPPTLGISTSPALYKGSMYVLGTERTSPRPTVVSLDMKTGKVNWEHAYDDDVKHASDAQGFLVADDKIWFGATTENAGTDTVVAARASDGSLLWKFLADEVMWNFSPSTPGDGSLLFSSMCGAAYRLSSEGKLMWRAGGKHPQRYCVPGGGAIGPNGMFYVNSNEGDGPFQHGGVNNSLAAYNIADGSLVWKKDLPYRAANHPAVGKLGSDGPLVVVAPLGDNARPPMSKEQEQFELSSIGGKQRNMVIAADAATGKTLWISEEEPWPGMVGAGDSVPHPDGACYPDAQGIPLISGDGTVYTSSSHHGDLRAIKDSNNDGVISPSEVSSFKTGKCFLNSPSIAPGMLVAAPCWGPMYVFKD